MGIKSKIKNTIHQLRTKEMIPIPQPVNVQKLLEGRVALITGGSGGIGYAIAKAFLESGCKVVIAGTNESKLQSCCERLTSECQEIRGGTQLSAIICSSLY